MTREEFSNEFDVLYNNVTSNQAPGLDEYEKSVFLTKALKQIMLDYLVPLYNKAQQGYDDSPNRQVDFSSLTRLEYLPRYTSTDFSGMNNEELYLYITNNILKFFVHPGYQSFNSKLPLCESSNTLPLLLFTLLRLDASYTRVTFTVIEADLNNHRCTIQASSSLFELYFIDDNPKEWMSDSLGYYTVGNSIVSTLSVSAETSSYVSLIDDRAIAFYGPKDRILYILNERIVTKNPDGHPMRLTVVPITYIEYSRLMSKPYKWPVKNQAWRLIHNEGDENIYEIITPYLKINSYSIRYVKHPMPVILGDLSVSNLSIEGYNGTESFYTEGRCCEAPEVLHEPILQKAVELAKAAYTGDLNSLLALGMSSQTEAGIVTGTRGNQ